MFIVGVGIQKPHQTGDAHSCGRRYYPCNIPPQLSILGVKPFYKDSARMTRAGRLNFRETLFNCGYGDLRERTRPLDFLVHVTQAVLTSVRFRTLKVVKRDSNMTITLEVILMIWLKVYIALFEIDIVFK